MLAGGALTVTCGLHLSGPPTGAPICLVPAGASIQDGQLQWAADPTRFFVPGIAIASLKVIPILYPIWCPGLCCACSGGPSQRLNPSHSLYSMATNNSVLSNLMFGQMIRAVCLSCNNMTSAKLCCRMCHLHSGWTTKWLSITRATVSVVQESQIQNAIGYTDL